MFVKIMKFMKSEKEDEDSKGFHDMFKQFVKMVWHHKMDDVMKSSEETSEESAQASKESKLASLESKLASKESELASLESELDSKESELASMESDESRKERRKRNSRKCLLFS